MRMFANARFACFYVPLLLADAAFITYPRLYHSLYWYWCCLHWIVKIEFETNSPPENGNVLFFVVTIHTLPHLKLGWFPCVQVIADSKCTRLIPVRSSLPCINVGVRVELKIYEGNIKVGKFLKCSQGYFWHGSKWSPKKSLCFILFFTGLYWRIFGFSPFKLKGISRGYIISFILASFPRHVNS